MKSLYKYLYLVIVLTDLYQEGIHNNDLMINIILWQTELI